MIQHVLDDSFYLWANGGWLRKKVKLSDQKNDSSGILEDARIRVQKDLQDIMDRLTMADRNSLSEREKKILDFYHASTNTAIIEGKGLSEFLPVLQTCRRINEDPSGVLAELHSQYGVNTLFCLRSMIDRKNSDNTKCSLFLDTTRGFYKDFEHMAGLGLNDYHDRAKPLAHETRTHFPEGITEKKCLLCTVKLYSKKNLTVNYCTSSTVIYFHTVNILLYSKYLLSDSKYLLYSTYTVNIYCLTVNNTK